MTTEIKENERKLTIARAMAEALAQEMRIDPRVFVMGEDIGALGGVYGNTRGLIDEFGAERVRDTPISETAFVGAAVGAAQDGMRPVVELMFVDFFGVCFDAIYNLMAKNTYFSNGSFRVPMVLMTSTYDFFVWVMIAAAAQEKLRRNLASMCASQHNRPRVIRWAALTPWAAGKSARRATAVGPNDPAPIT